MLCQVTFSLPIHRLRRRWGSKWLPQKCIQKLEARLHQESVSFWLSLLKTLCSALLLVSLTLSVFMAPISSRLVPWSGRGKGDALRSSSPYWSCQVQSEACKIFVGCRIESNERTSDKCFHSMTLASLSVCQNSTIYTSVNFRPWSFVY